MIQTLARELPLTQLLLEWLTGEPGWPRHLQQVVTAVAELRGMTEVAVTTAVRQNLAKLLGLDQNQNELMGTQCQG